MQLKAVRKAAHELEKRRKNGADALPAPARKREKASIVGAHLRDLNRRAAA